MNEPGSLKGESTQPRRGGIGKPGTEVPGKLDEMN